MTLFKLFRLLFLSALFIAISISCTQQKKSEITTTSQLGLIPVIIDTDANNELDDQHAMAYLFFNDGLFDMRGVTVNATLSGGEIDKHLQEANRIMKLCAVPDEVPLFAGANDRFENIRHNLMNDEFDGHAAVDFLIKEARKERKKTLVLLPVGKLTNIALALEKAPDIKSKVRIVWLGSNYPEKGEYNQDNDVPALNYILEQDVTFEVVTVRYGKPSGSDAVKATLTQIENNMPGAGPQVEPVVGRHGGSFTNFGDYSVELFVNSKMYGDPPSRALFDMVAVAILKNPDWGEQYTIPAPTLSIIDESWVERPENPRQVVIWENFNKAAIMSDFYTVMKER